MKLDGKDIKAIVASRYWRERHRAWKVASMLLGVLCLSVILIEITDSIISVLPVALGLASLIWIGVKADRYVANFVAEWEKSTWERIEKR